jgi:membrane protease YdiL (CAAX protease family)
MVGDHLAILARRRWFQHNSGRQAVSSRAGHLHGGSLGDHQGPRDSGWPLAAIAIPLVKGHADHTTTQLATSMDQPIATEILRGVLLWMMWAIFFGTIASWLWTIRRLLRGQAILPESPIVERRKPPWGLGTIFLMLVVYVIVTHFGLTRYAAATRGEPAPGRVKPAIRVDQANQKPRFLKAEGPRAEEKPRKPDGREPHEPLVEPPARPDENEAEPWGLSLTELMFVQAAISVLLIVLLPGLARLTSGARLRDFGLSLRNWRRQAATGIVAVLLLMPVVFTIQWVCLRYLDVPDLEKRKHPVEKMLEDELSFGVGYLAFVTAVIVAPLFEELLFRGIIQSWLVKLFDRFAGWLRANKASPVTVHALADPNLDLPSAVEGPEMGYWTADEAPGTSVPEEVQPVHDPPAEVSRPADSPYRPRSPVLTAAAIVLTSLLFASLHAAQWPAPIPLFVLALGLGIVYQRTGSLLAPICMHALFNGLSTFAMFYKSLEGPATEQPAEPPVLERVVPAEKTGLGTPNVGQKPLRGKT